MGGCSHNLSSLLSKSTNTEAYIKRGVHFFMYFLSLMRTPHLSRQLHLADVFYGIFTSIFRCFVTKCGVCIRDRKYLNRCTPLFDVNRIRVPVKPGAVKCNSHLDQHKNGFIFYGHSGHTILCSLSSSESHGALD